MGDAGGTAIDARATGLSRLPGMSDDTHSARRAKLSEAKQRLLQQWTRGRGVTGVMTIERRPDENPYTIAADLERQIRGAMARFRGETPPEAIRGTSASPDEGIVRQPTSG